MGFDLIVESRGKSGIRICLKITEHMAMAIDTCIVGAICQCMGCSQCPIRNKLTFLFAFDHFYRVQKLQGLGSDTWAIFSSNDSIICPGRSPAALSISQSVEFEFTNEC